MSEPKEPGEAARAAAMRICENLDNWFQSGLPMKSALIESIAIALEADKLEIERLKGEAETKDDLLYAIKMTLRDQEDAHKQLEQAVRLADKLLHDLPSCRRCAYDIRDISERRCPFCDGKQELSEWLSSRAIAPIVEKVPMSKVQT